MASKRSQRDTKHFVGILLQGTPNMSHEEKLTQISRAEFRTTFICPCFDGSSARASMAAHDGSGESIA